MKKRDSTLGTKEKIPTNETSCGAQARKKVVLES
jgi:hypothetical protein